MRHAAVFGWFVFLCSVCHAEMHTFTDVQGRKLKAEIVAVDDSAVTIKLGNGRNSKIARDKLSDEDQDYVSEWQKDHEENADEADAGQDQAMRAEMIQKSLVAFCKEHMGKQVGNGECWTLADEAFKACKLKRPTEDARVWGRLVDWEKEKLMPGDIVEYRSAKFSNGSATGPEHTSVVIKGGRKSGVIAEQNWGGDKTVRESSLDLKDLTSGEIMVYRPE